MICRKSVVVALLAALPAAAWGEPQFTAEDIVEHFTRDGAAAPAAAVRLPSPRTRGVFIGAAGFGGDAAANAAAPVPQGTAGATPSADALTPVAEAPLVIPPTGAGGPASRLDRPEESAGSAPPGSYDLLVTFELDSARLTEQARRNLDEFVRALRFRALAESRFAVEGHTDATGADSYNMALSRRRAASVVDYLVARGIESSRLLARGFGESRPLAADPENPANRRVETRRLQ